MVHVEHHDCGRRPGHEGDRSTQIRATRRGVLQFSEVETPVPADDEVLVRIHTASVHIGDYYTIEPPGARHQGRRTRSGVASRELAEVRSPLGTPTGTFPPSLSICLPLGVREPLDQSNEILEPSMQLGMLSCMQSTSVRIDIGTHEELKRLSSELGTSVGETVALAVRRLRQEQIGKELTASLTAQELQWLDAEIG